MTDPNFKPKIVLHVHVLSPLWRERACCNFFAVSLKNKIPLVPTDREKPSSTLVGFKINVKFLISGREPMSLLISQSVSFTETFL